AATDPVVGRGPASPRWPGPAGNARAVDPLPGLGGHESRFL
ncbi:MAG: hypothetical protein AVDCRST_MAG02-3210, partial [uncultured Rubrobacteraceae bacterium]